MHRLRINKARGFTLIELIVVVLIIGILAAIAIIGYGAITDNAREKAFTADARQVATAVSAESVSNDTVSKASEVGQTFIDNLDVEGTWTISGDNINGTSADQKKQVVLDASKDVVEVGEVTDVTP